LTYVRIWNFASSSAPLVSFKALAAVICAGVTWTSCGTMMRCRLATSERNSPIWS